MKTAIRKLRLITAIRIVTVQAASLLAAEAQDTIIYANGPSFPFGDWETDGVSLDLNRDGVLDFRFEFGPFLCTTDVPCSGCSCSFYVISLGKSVILREFSQATVMPFGALVGSDAVSNTAAWSDPGEYVLAAVYSSSPPYGTRGYSGQLAKVNTGYLEVRIAASDGWRYGWIGLRMPAAGEFAPLVVDWACETRSGIPIQAGAKPVPMALAAPVVARPGYLRLQWSSELI